MSSQTDMPALAAKNARLEAQLRVSERKTASKIKELEDKIKALEQEVVTLELDKEISAPASNNQGPQPAVSTGSSDPVLLAENSRLQQEIAAKNATIVERAAIIAGKDTIINQNDEKVSGWIKRIRSYREAVIAVASQDIDEELQAEPASPGHQSGTELTRKVSITDSDKSKELSLTSPPKNIQDDSASGSPQAPPEPVKVAVDTSGSPRPLLASIPAMFLRDPVSGPPRSSSGSTSAKFPRDSVSGPPQSSSDSTPAKFTADTASAPTVQPKSAPLDYAQAFKTPREKVPRRKAKVDYSRMPMFSQSPMTHAALYANKQVAAGLTHTETQEPQVPQKPDKPLPRGGAGHESPRGRGDPTLATAVSGMSPDRQSSKAGDDRTATKESQTTNPEPRNVVSDPKSVVESSTSPALEKGRPPLAPSESPATRNVRGVNPEPSTTSQSPTSGRLPQADPVKESSNDASVKDSQDTLLQASHAEASRQPPVTTASSTVAMAPPPTLAPVGFQFPYGSQRLGISREIPAGYNPYTAEQLEESDDGLDIDSMLKGIGDDTDKPRGPEQPETISMKPDPSMVWADEEPEPGPVQNKPVVPKGSDLTSWNKFPKDEGEANRLRALEWKNRRGSHESSTTRYQEIALKETWRRSAVGPDDKRRVVDVLRGDNILKSGEKKGSRSVEAGGEKGKQV